MNYKPGSPIIMGPLFTNDARTRIGAVVRDPEERNNVRWMEDARESKSQFVYDVFSQYDEAEIEKNTKREMRIVHANRKARSDAAKREVRTRASEELFRAKDEAVEAIEDKRLRRMARKAQTVDEVTAVRAADILRSLPDEDTPTVLVSNADETVGGGLPAPELDEEKPNADERTD